MTDDFEIFVEASFSRLYGFAFVLTGDRHDAWDLVQEALMRVGVRWRRQAPRQPMAYTRQAMVRLNLDRVRRLRRELLPGRERVQVPVEQVTDIDPWLIEALAGLTPRQRTVIALRFVEDLDLAGIAARLGCSVGTVKSHLSRGLEQLRTRADERDPAHD